MRSLLRRAPVALPGLVGTMHADRRVRALLPRLRAGDIAVLDVQDLDADTARALVATKVAAVVNSGPMVSGRYPTLGPGLLADAGVSMVDRIGQAGYDALTGLEGRRVRLHDGDLFLPDETVELASGRELDGAGLAHDLESARGGLAVQLESLDRDGSSLIHDEQALLLHGQGLPALTTRVAGRPVVVVAPGPVLVAQLRGLKHYLREQRPVVVAVDGAIAEVRRHGLRVDVAVLQWGAALPGESPATIADLGGIADVVVRLAPGDSGDILSDLQRQGLSPLTVESAVATADLALLLVHGAGASVIVGVGTGRTVEQLIDARGTGEVSHLPTRLRVGPRLVDAVAVGQLYSGRLRPRHLFLVLLVGLIAVAVAVATTPVGNDWAHQLGNDLQRWFDDARSWLTDHV